MDDYNEHLKIIYFIYAFDQSDSNLFVQKYGVPHQFFLNNGPEVQAILNDCYKYLEYCQTSKFHMHFSLNETL